MSFYVGKVADVTWSATSQPMDKFDLDFKAEVIDTTNFTSLGYQSNLAGVFSCDGSAEGPYNGSSGLTQGQLITITFSVGGGGPSFAMPMRNSSIRVGTATRNQVARYSMAMTSSGVFSVTF